MRGQKGVRPRRGRFGDLIFTQRFTAFDRVNQEGVKHFKGFFVLMWLGVCIFVIKTAAENYRVTGHIFAADILSIMFERNHLFDCLLTDAIMFFGSTLWNVPLQLAVQRNTISWNRSGWILQSLWQMAYLYIIISYTLYKQWPWIQTVFLMLHCLALMMKQHSYAFYNGHLSEVYKRRQLLEEKLERLKDEGATTTGADVDSALLHHRRRSSVGQLDISHFPNELSPKQASRFVVLLDAEIEACDAELSLEATNSPRVTYPENLTFANYLEYIHLPTLVYEPCYPREKSIDWSYVAEKAVATFGILGYWWLCRSSLFIQSRLAEFPWILLKLVFPFMMCYLCVWYLIWELILNLLAELTCFSDRGFYGDWWNSVTWDQFARDWNKPVHNFLLRHVYHSSISTFQISRETATLITFLISAVVHELVMWCIFGKLRGYLLCSQMMQLPLVALSRTKFMKGKETLGNVLFWMGLWTGPSFLSASYLIL
ncbi:MBOAT, membrane-bound O-acyltransferase family-domain-containing protein [Trichophaea hybrida]|nr:MBOAT, membrane-bound O-acyltransferase family-domain-containing protein [Trichophaea hybrida]